MPRLDQREPATAGAQEFGGVGAVDQSRLGADQEHQARLLVAGRRDLRRLAIGLAHDARQRRARKRRVQRRDDDGVDARIASRIEATIARSSECSAPSASIEPPGPEAEDHRRRRERPGQQAELPPEHDQHDDRADAEDHRQDEPPAGAAHQPALARQHMRIDDAGDQDRDRRIERQHVVRQLGHHQLEHDPGRHDPGQQEFRALLAPRRPDARHRHARRASRPARTSPRTARNNSPAARHGPPAPLDHLAQQIVADRFGEEAVAGAAHDGEEPRQHQEAEPDHARESAAAPRASAPSGRSPPSARRSARRTSRSAAP